MYSPSASCAGAPSRPDSESRAIATLKLQSLTKRFGDVTAVDQLDLVVGDGEFLCLLGPSGCGKTTALRMIAGFETPTSGDILIDQSSMLGTGANKRPTAMVFQQYTLWPHMSVHQNIAYGLQLRRMPRNAIHKKVEEGLELVGLAGYGRRLPAQLSGGQQQRVALARALVLEPKILLLDEPFSSLDAALRVRLREELLRIQRMLRITAIFVTHDQEEALSLADRIALMQSGQIEQLDSPSEMYARPRNLFAAEFIGAMNLLPAKRESDRLRMGQQILPCPTEMHGSDGLTVAIRPEDFAVEIPEPSSSSADIWRGEVEQAMDMGHYQKALISSPGMNEPLKVFIPKTLAVREGVQVALQPVRFLVYQDGQRPVEVIP